MADVDDLREIVRDTHRQALVALLQYHQVGVFKSQSIIFHVIRLADTRILCHLKPSKGRNKWRCLRLTHHMQILDLKA